MLAIYSEGMLLSYSSRMTSHQNEKDRWSRHYGCSQNFSSVALFGRKHPYSRSDVRSFWKLNLENSYELIVTCTPGQFLYSYLPGLDLFILLDKLFTKCLNLLFSPSPGQAHDEKWSSGHWQKNVRLCDIEQIISAWGAKQFSDCKVFGTVKEVHWSTWSAT